MTRAYLNFEPMTRCWVLRIPDTDQWQPFPRNPMPPAPQVRDATLQALGWIPAEAWEWREDQRTSQTAVLTGTVPIVPIGHTASVLPFFGGGTGRHRKELSYGA